ncbi:hypothetical protein GQ457_15G002920 [Hibiscus cannabinus]
MAACILPLSAINDAFIAEAKACEAAVTFAIELGFRSIQVEGDSLTVIKKLSSSSSDKSIIRPIISDIKSTLVFFEKITFSHVGRRGNEAAHMHRRMWSKLPFVTSTSDCDDSHAESSMAGFPPKPRKGDESISELVEILSGEAKVVDVELG